MSLTAFMGHLLGTVNTDIVDTSCPVTRTVRSRLLALFDVCFQFSAIFDARLILYVLELRFSLLFVGVVIPFFLSTFSSHVVFLCAVL